MFPDVPQRRCSQQRIHDRMEQDIRIRMSQKSLFIRYFHAADDEVSSLHQTVYVISHSDSHTYNLSADAILKNTGIPVSHRLLQPASPQTVLSRCGQCRAPISSAICQISVIIVSPQHNPSDPPCCRIHRRYNCRPHIPFRPDLMPEPLHIPHTPPPSGAGMSPRHDTLPHNIS